MTSALRTDWRSRIAVVAAMLGVLACIGSLVGSRGAIAQTARAIVVTPSEQLVDGQYVDVQLSGFQQNKDVIVRLCPSTPKSVDDCAVEPDRPQDPGHTRNARMDSNGNGSTPFVIKALDVAPRSGGPSFQCDANNPCTLYAFDTVGNHESAFTDSASATLRYALSTLACPEPEPRVAGSGAAAIRADMVEWQAETCSKPSSLNVSFSTSNSVNGKQAFVQGLTDADFAMSGTALTDAEQQALVARNVQALHIPVALGSLVLAYNLWIDENGAKVQVTNLQLSPATAAKIIEGRISNWNDGSITEDNKANYPNGLPSKLIIPVGRADNSAATWWLSSWLYTTAKDAWESGGDSFKGGPTTIFPAGNGVDLRTGANAVALDVREFPGQQGSNGIPEGGLIGFVYMSDALKLGLPVAALQNASQNYVKPTTQSIMAAVASGSVSSEGVFLPNFNTTDPAAYPIPVVTYAIVPKAGTSALDPAHELVLSKFLRYAVGDGQKAAELRGYAPLPDTLLSKSNAAIAQIYAAPAATPAPTAAPPRTTAVPQAAPASISAAPAQVAQATIAPANSGDGASAPRPVAVGTPAAPVAAPAAPVAKVVSGIVKLLGGGSAPVTVSGFLWLGALAVIVGRAISILSERRRRTPARAPLRQVRSVDETS